MLDIKFIRDNPDLVAAAAEKKHIKFDVKELLTIDKKRVELTNEVDHLREEQNRVSKTVAETQDQEKRAELIRHMREHKEKLQAQESQLKELMQEWQVLMLQVPNIPDVSVPEGKTDENNLEVKLWGEKPSFDFEPKDHVELMTKLDLADFERGTKVSGFRGYILKNDGFLLQQALLSYVLDKLVKKGFTPMQVPSLVRKETLLGTGYLPQGEDDLYKTQDDDYLAGTGEVSTMSYYRDEVLKKEDLPIKFLAFSTCFRREAGSHGKDVKGLYRVHEFYKLEQVVLSEASHEESVTLHEELTMNAEEILQDLGLHYHVVVNCGGDLGLGQVKKYDIEAWIPSQDKYGETHSSSYFHDFQTRRLNIKYDDGEKKRLAHSLNNTAIAFPRILIPVIENNQNEDGTITIPEVLRPYMGGKSIIS
ncbi:MAG: seryl-tRNA synthetase [Candidatus Paceibacteria bacterium]|jgi:seryl-tRNA synthetase